MTQFPVSLYNVHIMTLCVIISCAYISHFFHVMALYVIICHYFVICIICHYFIIWHYMSLYVIIVQMSLYAIISWCFNLSLCHYMQLSWMWGKLDGEVSWMLHNMSQYDIICQYIPLYVLQAYKAYILICA